MGKTNTTKNTDTDTVEMMNSKPSYEELEQKLAELEQTLAEKEAELEKKNSSSGGRKAEVLAFLKEHGHVKVSDIAKAVGISDRNVSSQLTYLRKDGYAIATDSRGFKFLENTPEEAE